jgi:hypothetical protein
MNRRDFIKGLAALATLPIVGMLPKDSTTPPIGPWQQEILVNLSRRGGKHTLVNHGRYMHIYYAVADPSAGNIKCYMGSDTRDSHILDGIAEQFMARLDTPAVKWFSLDAPANRRERV